MLTIDHVSEIYPDGTQVLADLSLSVGPGKMLVLLGVSGCGKTSLLRIIAGLEPVSRGTVALDGARIAGPHPSIGLVSQEARLMPWLSAAQNVAFGLAALPPNTRWPGTATNCYATSAVGSNKGWPWAVPSWPNPMCCFMSRKFSDAQT